MAHFPSFPDCCQKCLADLEREQRTGMRNCEKGHAVSLEYARMIEEINARKAAEAAAKAAEEAKKPPEVAKPVEAPAPAPIAEKPAA